MKLNSPRAFKSSSSPSDDYPKMPKRFPSTFLVRRTVVHVEKETTPPKSRHADRDLEEVGDDQEEDHPTNIVTTVLHIIQVWSIDKTKEGLIKILYTDSNPSEPMHKEYHIQYSETTFSFYGDGKHRKKVWYQFCKIKNIDRSMFPYQ